MPCSLDMDEVSRRSGEMQTHDPFIPSEGKKEINI